MLNEIEMALCVSMTPKNSLWKYSPVHLRLLMYKKKKDDPNSHINRNADDHESHICRVRTTVNPFIYLTTENEFIRYNFTFRFVGFDCVCIITRRSHIIIKI